MTKLPDAPLLGGIDFWDHQKKAIEIARKYISNFTKGDTTKASLIHMPTGTGKTGVIASLARCLPEVNSVMILSPRIALRHQLYCEIRSDFFRKLNINPDDLPKDVLEIKESYPSDLETHGSTVLISTIQKLDRLKKISPKDYEKLATSLSLVIFDEGHYEPSHSWSEAIRGFHSPQIIFTATPYRNDYKLFNIDISNSYSYTLKEAEDSNIVRKVEIVDCQETEDIAKFVDDIINFYNTHFTENNSAKVIVRCSMRGTIRRVANEFRVRGHECVAIHETFKDPTRPWEFRQVPSPQEREEIFWIHQYKLLEGIDDPNFQMLALFQPLHNARSFIQQVGRIIRNPSREPNQVFP